MDRPYPKPRNPNAKAHIFKKSKLNGTCFKSGSYPGVTKLDIYDCTFEDRQLSILRYYPSLVFLSIQNSAPIENFEGLSNCPNLKSLIIGTTMVNSMHGIEFCQELMAIEMVDTRVNNLDFLEGAGLKTLIVREYSGMVDRMNGPIPRLPENLPRLLSLCYYDSVSLVERIPSYPRLKILSLSAKSIKEIGRQPKLTLANVTGTRIRDLEFLRDSPVSNVECSGNAIRSIDALTNSGVVNLRCLGNRLTRLTKMPSLVELSCERNRIFTLEDLSESTKLTTLNCSDNRLLNLRGLERARCLRTLTADNNDIFDIGAIKDHSSFDQLSFRKNMIMYLPDCRFLNTRAKYGHYCFNGNLIEDITHLTNNTNIWVYVDNNPLNPESLGIVTRIYSRRRGFVI